MAQAEARSGEVVLAEAHAVAGRMEAITVAIHLLRRRPERVIVEL